MESSFWPLFDLELSTERLLLRPPRDTDFSGLIAAVDEGIHGPDEMPFGIPWTDAEPSVRRVQSAQHWWGQRATWKVDDWHLSLAVFLDGRPIGVQGVMAKKFAQLREVSTGSWLTRNHQRKGYGREMRAAVLHLAFDCLGAQVARSAAFTDNPASQAVSRAVGYRENGRSREAPRGVPKEMVHFELTREEWGDASQRFPATRVSGLERCIHMFLPTSGATGA
jgi:RimJ/RimL family protein N-acetyltransferase